MLETRQKYASLTKKTVKKSNKNYSLECNTIEQLFIKVIKNMQFFSKIRFCF